jgi:hypothetical protein
VLEQTKERVRSARYGAWLDEVAQDVRYALRISSPFRPTIFK